MRAPLDELRVVVADDHALYRRGLVMELDDADGLEVIAEASDGAEAVEETVALAPDVVLMDVRMPGMDGIEATRRILEQAPTVRVLMLSVSDDTDDLLEAVKAGAAGYLLKETSIADIADSVRALARGDSFVSPALAGRLLEEFAALARREHGAEGFGRGAMLSDGELVVLEALANGATDDDVAAATGLSASSARNHVRNILEKLQLSSRTEAVLYAMRTRLIDP